MDAIVQIYASIMILNIHRNASCIYDLGSAPALRDIFCWIAEEGQPICPNDCFHALITMLKFVLKSFAETELRVLFPNMHKKSIHYLIHEELGHHQSTAPVSFNNETAVIIGNGTIKQNHSCIFKMRYLYCCDQVARSILSRVEP